MFNFIRRYTVKAKQKHLRNQVFCSPRQMSGRRKLKQKCYFLILFGAILVSVFIVSDKYDLHFHKDSQHNTTEVHGLETIISNSVERRNLVYQVNRKNEPIANILIENNGLPVQNNNQITSTKYIDTISSTQMNGRLYNGYTGKDQAYNGYPGKDQAYNGYPGKDQAYNGYPGKDQAYNGYTGNQTVKNKNKRLTNDEAEEILSSVEKWFLVQNESDKDRFLNKHHFTFLLNSRTCENHVDILIFVHSAPAHLERREEIRKTWGSIKGHRNLSIATVFMLGETMDPVLSQKLTAEALTYGDAVQGNFLDSYRNLTYKHVMALHWITSYCSEVRTIVKVDDDILINIYKLVNLSTSLGHVHNNFYCSYFFRGKPIRYVTDKWYTPYEMYPFEVYPTYCEGLAYIISSDEVRRLYKASDDMRFYWVDDVYVTGILARKAGIAHVHFEQKHRYVKKSNISKDLFKDVMFYLDYDDWFEIWNRIKINRYLF